MAVKIVAPYPALRLLLEMLRNLGQDLLMELVGLSFFARVFPVHSCLCVNTYLPASTTFFPALSKPTPSGWDRDKHT